MYGTMIIDTFQEKATVKEKSNNKRALVFSGSLPLKHIQTAPFDTRQPVQVVHTTNHQAGNLSFKRSQVNKLSI